MSASGDTKPQCVKFIQQPTHYTVNVYQCVINFTNYFFFQTPSCSIYCVIKPLTHWGRVTHICISKLTITGSDNGLWPGWHLAIFWTNAGIVLIWTLGANFNIILSEIHMFTFIKIYLKTSSVKWCPFCLGLKVLNVTIKSADDLYQMAAFLICLLLVDFELSFT